MVLAHGMLTTSPMKCLPTFPRQVDPVTGEIAGVFESIQPSDTDLGAKPPKDIKVTGLWYAQLK